MATLYFYDSTGVGNWNNTANWYTGAYSGGVPTGHANRIPTTSDNVVLGYSGNTDWQHLSILTNSGATAVCNTFNIWGNPDVNNDVVSINIEVNNSGMATFHEYTVNDGIIDHNATFNDYSFNGNTVNGDAVFNGYSVNAIQVNGSATFNDYSINNNGTVSGTTIFNYPAYIGGVNGGTSLGGVILAGSYPFKQDSSYWYWFNFSGDDDYNNWANWVYWGGGHSSSVWESSVDRDTPYTIGGSPVIVFGITPDTMPDSTGIGGFGFALNATNPFDFSDISSTINFYNNSVNSTALLNDTGTGGVGAAFYDYSSNTALLGISDLYYDFHNHSFNDGTIQPPPRQVTYARFYDYSYNIGYVDNAIFENVSVTGTTATDNTGYASGSVRVAATPSVTITDWLFSSTNLNSAGAVTGNAAFTNSTICQGTVTGNGTFSGTSQNQGTISGVGTFSGSSISSGIVVGNATFNGASYNTGVIQSNGYFHSTQSSSGTIDGNAYVYTPYPYPFSATVLGTIYYYGYNFIPGVVLNTSTIGATVTTPLNTSTVGTTISVVLSA